MKQFTLQEYEKLADEKKACLQSINEEQVVDTLDNFLDFYHDLEIDDKMIQDAKSIAVFERDNFHISPSWLRETLEDYCCDHYGMDGHDWDYAHIDKDAVNTLCNVINKDNGHFYQAGKKLGFIDLSKELKEYKDERDEE